MDDFDQFLSAASSLVTLPTLLVSPILAIFTFYCVLDEQFALKDRMTVGLLWFLMLISFVVLQVVWRNQNGVNKKLEFWLESIQMITLVASCCALLSSAMLRY
jgi:hypothetical protein